MPALRGLICGLGRIHAAASRFPLLSVVVNVLIAGCGYLGLRVAARLISQGHTVSALTRSVRRGVELARAGLIPIVGDVMAPESLARLPDAEVLVYAVGFDPAGGAEKRRLYVEGLRNVLGVLAGRLGRCVYVSSSSVYGEADGEWVDEQTPARPGSEGGRICLAAEEVLLEGSAPPEVCVLRMSGLYGPNRLLARLEQLRSGTALAGRPDAWLNLIHIEDAATATVCAATSSSPARLYLVSDDQPTRREEYFAELASLTCAPPPTFDATQAARRGQGLNKRCRNRRMRESLGIELRFPTIKEGLPHALMQGGLM